MNNSALFTLAATVLTACSSPTVARTCLEDPSQASCPADQAVGTAYVTPGGMVNLISLDGTRVVSWNSATGTFGPAMNITSLEGGGIPLTSIGAAGTTVNGAETFLFDKSGEHYTTYQYGTGMYDEAKSFGPNDDLGTPTITEVGAISRAANTARFFVFDRAGTSQQLWQYGNKTWTTVESFADNFGGGGAPIDNVGAAVYVDGIYYLFDVSGTQWATYLGNFVFEGPFETSELGDGSLDFR